MTRVRVLVVDDEKPARGRLRRLLEADARVEVVGGCAGGAHALHVLRDEARAGRPVDILLLDVQMPEMDGFGVVAALRHEVEEGQLPAIVFVTAHDEHALAAFEAHAIDYLLKPFSDERFQASLDRAIRQVRAGHAQAVVSRLQALLAGEASWSPRRGAEATVAPILDRILLKGPDRVRLLSVHQIVRIEAAGMYVKIHTREGAVHLHRGLLGDLEAALDGRRFVRIHRSTIVNVDVIEELRRDAHGDTIVVLKDRTELRLGRRYRDRLRDRLGQDL